MITKKNRLHALERQISRLERRLVELRRRSDRYTAIRLAVFLVGLALSLGALYILDWPGIIVVAAWIAAFSVAVYYHRQIRTSIRSHEIWRELKITQIARIQLNWAEIPLRRSIYAPEEHPFASDLDLTGERSIHQLLDTAISREGSQRLQDWLLNTTPNPEIIDKRQALARELTPMTLFRDKLILNATLAATGLEWEGRRLLDWLSQRAPANALQPTLVVLLILSVINLTLFLLNLAGVLPPYWIISGLTYAALLIIGRQAIDDLFQNTMYFANALRKLGAVLHYLELYPYGKHERLKELCAPLLNQDSRPTIHLRRIARVASAASVQYNPVLWMLLNAVVPWDIYFAHRLNQHKAKIADRLPAWLDIWYELEAQNALASFAYLNPEYTFPEIVMEPGETILRVQGLGHPLIPYTEKVGNDFAMHTPGKIVIITGSNMAGKSSFLRTLGVNLSLAYAGGPVNATALQVSLFRIFSCINVTDSVIDGISYFYAEVRRLKALLAALEEKNTLPLFFLIDEIFRGTNNRERLIGSRAYIRALAGQHGIGLIATHDLELLKLAEEIQQLDNYHFREEVVDGRMVFDYKLRPGPCPTTNALTIMQMAGLPIESITSQETR